MTVVAFTPNPRSSFNFQATFDGLPHTCVVSWNLTGQRYYIYCQNARSVQVFNFALTASPDDYDINLLDGYFTASTMVFRESSQVFEIVP